MPAVRGEFHLGMKLKDRVAGGKIKAHLFLTGETTPLAELKEMDWPEDMNEWDREEFGWDRRIWLVPEAKVLVTIPLGKDKLVLRTALDAADALAKSGVDYLVVTSRPAGLGQQGQGVLLPPGDQGQEGRLQVRAVQRARRAWK